MDGSFSTNAQMGPTAVETAEAKGRLRPPMSPMRAFAEVTPDALTAAKIRAENEMFFESPVPHGALKAFNRIMFLGFAGLAAFGVVLAFLNA